MHYLFGLGVGRVTNDEARRIDAAIERALTGHTLRECKFIRLASDNNPDGPPVRYYFQLHPQLGAPHDANVARAILDEVGEIETQG